MPRDAISVHTNDPRIVDLADRLWDRAPAGAPSARRLVPAGVMFTIAVSSRDEAVQAPWEPPDERWSVGADEATLSLGDDLHASLDSAQGRVEGRVSARLIENHPSLVARLMLETPAAALLARRGYSVLHGGAVVGEAGAVVIRGPSGAGKSTLVAAAYRAGLEVLGDETVLVARDDPDDLLAAVREVILLPQSVHLVGLEDAVAVGTGRNGETRLDLFHTSKPARRRARRVATVLLGSRDHDPARLEPLAPDTFLEEFRRGEIPQERFWSLTPPHIPARWSQSRAYRLSGAADLAGAVALLTDLVTLPVAASRA